MDAAVLLALLLGAMPPAFDEGSCDAAAASRLIGKAGTPANGAKAQRLSGALEMRWIRPQQGITGDYHTSRLNIEVDRRNRIVRFSCG